MPSRNSLIPCFLPLLAAVSIAITGRLLGADDPAGTIKIIDFYGLNKVNQQQARAVLGLHEGDPVPRQASHIADAERRLSQIPGVARAALNTVHLDGNTTILYVGIEEVGAPRFDHRPAPNRNLHLPPEAVSLSERFDRAVQQAVLSNDAEDDMSQGHSLMKNPAARAVQEQILAYTAGHLEALRSVLRNAKDASQRAIAAEFLGYAPNKRLVVADLVSAVQDPDANVRNNATRALVAIANLAQAKPDSGISIPATPFIRMLHSVIWTDRNKALGVLQMLTEHRPAPLLSQIAKSALPNLVEMARWKASHGLAAFILLGRIAGLEDRAIFEHWEKGDRESVISKACAAR
jgi:hypothetical protein